MCVFPRVCACECESFMCACVCVLRVCVCAACVCVCCVCVRACKCESVCECVSVCLSVLAILEQTKISLVANSIQTFCCSAGIIFENLIPIITAYTRVYPTRV